MVMDDVLSFSTELASECPKENRVDLQIPRVCATVAADLRIILFKNIVSGGYCFFPGSSDQDNISFHYYVIDI
jgi:hypothetical protein